MTEDLKIIKKLYGEAMMHYCRESFPSILEEKGGLLDILQKYFAPSHMLYEDLKNNDLLNDFKNYIYDLFHKEESKLEMLGVPTPQELMRQAGYILYECENEGDIQSFKKYYAKGEELCTFRGGRLQKCYVFFAVKENVDEIKREDFPKPKRQDEYGTSVISIQFSRDESHTLSIKNRYNHTVENPDATFSNNLENITPGLTESFEQTYGLKQGYKNDGFELPGYVRANDGKWYKYNLEINNIYYCPDNIIIDTGEVKKYPKEKYIIMDYFILDLTQKTISLYDKKIYDLLPNVIERINKIIIEKKVEEKEIKIITEKNEEIIIVIDKNNQIVGFKSKYLKIIENNFLCDNKALKTLDMPNLEQIGNNFLYNNRALTNLYLPSLQKVARNFLYYNVILADVNLPLLQEVKDNFLFCNKALTHLNLPELQEVGDEFICGNRIISQLELPKLREVSMDFLSQNAALIKLELPSLQFAGSYFLYHNRALTDVRLPLLQEVESHFLHGNESLTTLELPMLQKVSDRFMASNDVLTSFKAPMLQEIGRSFLYDNKTLSSLEAPSLQFVNSDFLYHNSALTYLALPKLGYVGPNFLWGNEVLATLIVPVLLRAGKDFLYWNEALSNMECPSLKTIGGDFLLYNPSMREKVARQIEENQEIKR